MIQTGDCLEVMAGMPAESVDAVVTDPPAAVSFMGKSWDGNRGGRTQWVAWMTEVMAECYRLLKPGGYAVVWSLPRTCHWTAWAMEDAGFIIRDQLAHIFASGFPKGKAQLKPAREDWWLARKPGPLRPLGIDACRIGVTDADAKAMERANTPGSGRYYGSAFAGHIYGDPSGAPGKPLDTTQGRWPSNLLLQDPALFDEPNPEVVGSGATVSSPASYTRSPGSRHSKPQPMAWGEPHEYETVESYGDSGGYSRFFLIPKSARADREPVLRPDGHEKGKRFTSHPTVKPVSLMRHLIRLVTPIGGVLLDPFAGSGSTGVAATLEGFDFILIEKEPEYVQQIEARLNGTQRGLGLDVPAPTKQGFHLAGNKSPIRRRASGFIEERGTQGRWPDEEPAA